MKTSSLFGSASIPSFDRSQSKVGLKPSSPVGNLSDRENGSARSKKSRVRRTSNGSIKPMKTMSKKPKNMDFTDYTYREAVNRLKYLLAESYTAPTKTYGKHLHDDSGDDTDNLSVGSKALDRPTLTEISKYLSPSYRGARSTNSIRKMKPFPTLSKENLSVPTYTTAADYLAGPSVVPQQDGVQAPPEILNFIEKQEDYIEQLEKESKFCRNELSHLLGKVKDVITENETLTEHARADLSGLEDKFMSASSESDDNYEKFHKKKERNPRHQLSGPNIVFESRISELEAELAQANIDLKKLRAENDELKRHTAYCSKDSSSMEAMRKQVENLQMDKIQLEDTIRRLEHNIDDLKAENRVCSTKRQRDMADMAMFEKSQAEMEVKHLRDELERQHERIRELQHEMARRVSEERANAERRYNYQVDQLGGDLNSQWEQVSKLQMELEREKRLEADLKRDLSQRNAQIEELKMELKAKRSTFLSDIAQVNAEKQSLEQEITSLRLQLERADRQSKIEAARLNAEINSLRQRLDRADADILHTKRENLRLNDEIANLEKEVALGDMKNEVHPKRDINKTITEMQEKHASTVNELDEMITSQRQLMDKLTNECKTLTTKLEDTTLKHKMEISALQSNVEFLTNRVISSDRDRNDSYSNLATTKASTDYDTTPASTTSRPSISKAREETPPISTTLPYDYKSSIDTGKPRYEPVDITPTDEPYKTYDFGDDENKKDDFTERDKQSRSHSIPAVQQPLPTTQPRKSFDSSAYTARNTEQQPYTMQDDTNYSNQYQGYGEGYDQQQYEGGDYGGEYDQQYAGEDQQYEDYGQDYEQMYQPDGNFYNEEQQPQQYPITTAGPVPIQQTASAMPISTKPQPIPTTVPPSLPASVPKVLPTAVPTTLPTTISTALPSSVPTALPTTAPTSIPPLATIPTARPLPATTLPSTGAIPPPVVPTALEGRPQPRPGSGLMGMPGSRGGGGPGAGVLPQQPTEAYKGVSGPAKNQ